MARVLITGGAGFVGSQVAMKLVGEHDVLLLDNMRFGHVDNLVHDGRPLAPFVGRDIRDRNLASVFDGVDFVLHLAGIAPLPVCQADPAEAYDVNVTGTANILEHCRRAGVERVVFASTSALYEGSRAEYHHEEEALFPSLVYPMSKQAAERLCVNFSHTTGLDVVSCRFFNVYGPHQDMLRTSPPFTSYVARELALGRQPILFNQSDAKRDYVYVDDLVDLVSRIMFDADPLHGEVFNVASGTGHSVPELYGIMRELSGTEIDPVFRDPAEYWDRYPELFSGPFPLKRERVIEEVHKSGLASNAKARERFDWAPRVAIEEGLGAVRDFARTRAKTMLASS